MTITHVFTSIRILSFLIFVLVAMSSNQIYNNKIVQKQHIEMNALLQEKSFAVRCLPSSITIDKETEKVITKLDCDKGNKFTQTGFDSGIHILTGDYSILTGSSYDMK